MELVLLGTGCAGGWPNPFCRCASCQSARTDGARSLRASTSALVDDVLLVDLGPDVPHAATRHGVDLASVTDVLLTHGHADHTAPQALLWRTWSHAPGPLRVWGPAAALAALAPWLPPDGSVTTHRVAPTDVLELERHTVRVLPATHTDVDGSPGVLYDISAHAGGRLLYASDTGPLSPDALALVADAAFDVVLLEETFGDWVERDVEHPGEHLDLAGFPAELARLRACGAVGTGTRVVAVHLGHHNPPTAELTRRLAQWGAEVHPDGARLTVGPGPAAGGATRTVSRRVLITGGARSGKSHEAERRFADRSDVTYAATSVVDGSDPEWAARVQLHRDRRPSSWRTVEVAGAELAQLLRTAAPGSPVLVDCATLWLGALLEHPDRDALVDELVAAWRDTRSDAVIVTNEVGSGVVPGTPSGRAFRDALGRLNAALAAVSDEVWLTTAGCTQRLR